MDMKIICMCNMFIKMTLRRCQDQCSIGHVFAGGGGDVAVPFDCWLHLKSWKTHWSPEKKRWCCENSVQGSVACEDVSDLRNAATLCASIKADVN